jgi:hypothetical protein
MDESKLDSRLITSYLSRLGLPNAGTLPKRAERLEAAFKSFSEKTHHVSCDCEGVSDDRLVCCPFCGDREGATGTANSEAAAIAELVDAMRKGAPAERVSKDALVRPVIEDAEMLDGPELDLSDDDVKPEVLREKLSQAGMRIPAKATEADLDEAVAAIAVSHRNSLVTAYDLGAWLLKVRGLKLHLLRKKKGSDAPAYNNWSQFVAAETAITTRYANKLMATVWVFSRAEVESAGIKTLYILIGIQDPAKRQELAALASRGELTSSEAREQVHQLSGGQQVIREPGVPGSEEFKGKPNTNGKRKAAEAEEEPKKGKKDASKAPEPAIITMQVALGRHRVKLWKRGAKGSDRKPAKRIADDAHGELVLANGTVLRLGLQTSARTGQLEIVVDVARPDDTSHGG